MSRKNRTPEPVAVQDAFSNPLFRLGYGSRNPMEATEYPLTRLSQNYALLNSLYRSNWIVQNIITTVPADMTKKWFHVTGSLSPERMTQFERAQRAARLRKSINEGLNWGRLYGGAVGVLLLKGQEGRMDTPLDPDRIFPGDFAGLYIADRWSGVFPEQDLVTDMTDPDFGLPAFYTVRDASDRVIQKVHHTRVVRFLGRELPFYERMAENWWGESELEAIYEEVVKRDNVSHNMASLTFRACRDYMEMENADQLFSVASPQAQQRFWNMIEAQSVLDTNFGMRVVNKGDAVHNRQYTFTGLAEVYGSVMMDVAGAARIPVTKLFGRSPAGLNATGESDLQNYYDYIDEQRESVLRPILERLLPVLALSAWGEVPEDLDLTFPPLWTPTAAELAEIAAKKSQAVIDVFQAGLMDVAAAQRELKRLSDETGMFESIQDEAIAGNEGKSYQDVTELRDPFAGMAMEPEEDEKKIPTTDVLTLDYNPHHDPGNGRFTSGGGSGKIKGTKYAPSQRRSAGGITVSPKKYTQLCGVLNTRFPGAQAGTKRTICDAKYSYSVVADGFGGMKIVSRWKV